MKLEWFKRPPIFRNRMLCMILGVTVQGLGLSFLRQLDFGTDPCSALTMGVVARTGLMFGTAQVLCHLVTFAFVLRFDTSKIGFGTIGNMVCLGYISDFFTWIEGKVLPAGFFEPLLTRSLLLVPSLIVFLIGCSAYISADLGASPYDALPFIIHRGLENKGKKPSFKAIRVAWDMGFCIGAWILIGYFGGGLGIVTFLVAFFMGPLIAWMRTKIEPFCTPKNITT